MGSKRRLRRQAGGDDGGSLREAAAKVVAEGRRRGMRDLDIRAAAIEAMAGHVDTAAFDECLDEAFGTPRWARPIDVDERVGTIARMIVAFGRQCGDDDDKIRADARAAIREALEGDGEWKVTFRSIEDGAPTEGVTFAGMYRFVFEHDDADRSDQFKQERWLAIAQRATEEALADPDESFRSRGPGERIFDPRPDA